MAEEKTTYAFPQDLRNDDKNHPHITFTINTRTGTDISISLYMPPGVSFSDSMAYSSLDLGVLGQKALGAVGGDDMAGQLQRMSGRMASDAKAYASKYGIQDIGDAGKVVKVGSQMAAAALAAKLPGGTPVTARQIISLGQKKIFNPNANTKFDNPNIRSFAFTFKMMAESPNDSRDIKDIVKSLRKYMYPEKVSGGEELLSYPALFGIELFDGASDQVSENMPKIHECYLTALQTVYNA